MCPVLKECPTNPCLNGGTCYELIGTDSNICECLQEFTGDDCSIVKAKCVNDMPCQNGGVCERRRDGVAGYMCICHAGWLGSNCQTKAINECKSSPCKSGEKCIDLDDGFMCACEDTKCNNNAATTQLSLEPWWVALLSLIGFLFLMFIIFIIVVQYTLKRSDRKKKALRYTVNERQEKEISATYINTSY
ncbi:EGF-like repeat and discoidin I-like domain-containing protein 3 [Amphiura filiformis]|uniref:EGF-like repeat and discoidin I-like domain-containing protein 3 n=1 Tax=Amphiura filiformis TaxID=82378 RepID=UPI003B20EEBA